MSEAYIFPLSFTQQRLWFLDQISPKNPSYNITTGIEMNFPIQINIANRSLQELIQRHEILRTRFVTKGGKPYQLVSSKLDLEIRFVDISDHPANKLNDTVQVMVNQEMRNGFDLEKGPLLRVKILRLAESKNLFLLSMHHIISDGWSIGLFFQEFRILYEAISKGRHAKLKELPIQYADYSVWQHNWLKGKVLHDHLHYWKNQLADLQELQLETDFPRPPIQSYRGSYLQKVFPRDLVQAVEQLARKEGSTLFMGLLSGFFVLLHYYTRQTDLVIGTPIAGRNRAELEGLIGFFVNNLVFRADLSGDPSFRDLLTRIRKMTLDAYAHQDLPFERLVEELNLERDLSKNPIFQVTFQLINTPTLKNSSISNGAPKETPGEKAQNIQKGTAMFDMAIDLIQVPDGLMVQMEYSTDLFRSESIQQLIDHFQILLESIAQNPDQKISQLRYFDQAVLSLSAKKIESKETSLFAHQVFEEKATEQPDSIAIIDGEREVTFGDLNKQANQLAHALIAKDIGPGKLIGICLSSSFDMVLSMLSILKTGAAYTPLDPTYPAERLRQMAQHTDLMLTNHEMAEVFNFIAPKNIIYREDWDSLQSTASIENPQVSLSGQSLAYVIFTSGSTGQPKGAMIPHAALMNHMTWLKERYPLQTEDRVLQRTSFSFDASVWEIYAPLMEGAQLVLTAQEKKSDSHYLSQVMDQTQVTILQCVPSLLLLFHDLGLLINKNSLRRIFCGGEALPASLNNQILEQYPHLELVNLYGPTESTIDATYWHCQKLESDQTIAPIGQPISGVGLYLLDQYLNPVPAGVVGEIYLSGKSLGLGYYQMPKLTAERFLPDPFSKEEGQSMYRTGDLGKWLPDGLLQFKGRSDDQIKLRGYRIELGGITAVLQGHTLVKNAVVVLIKEELVAYYELNVDALEEKELRLYLQNHLPIYMLPALLVEMKKLPLSPNGKINRKALPEPLAVRENSKNAYVPPILPVDVLMAEIWQEILGTENIGLNHHFFRDLGGHSLLATQLISRIRQQLKTEVSLQRIFEFPTLAAFSEIVQQDSPEPEQLVKTAELLVSVNQMSEEEIDRLLLEED